MTGLRHYGNGDEHGLLQAARAGDERALARLLAPHWGGLKLFCGLMLGDADAAARAVAEVVLTAQAEAEMIESAASVRIWIHRIAARVCCEAAGEGLIQNDQPPEAQGRAGADFPTRTELLTHE